MIARRKLLTLGLGCAAGVGLGVAPGMAGAQVLKLGFPDSPRLSTPALSQAMRSVALNNLHTGESLQAVYWEQGDYVVDVLDAVNSQLRDYRTGDIYPIDPSLLDLLDAVSTATGSRQPFQVISGYRSPKTNEMLHERSAEVAKKSFHTKGMAIDVRLADVELRHLHAAALSLGRGGVGLYPESDFVHLDVGPVRTWHGA